MKLCKCGCGGEIPKDAHYSTRYLPGHKPGSLTYLLGKVCDCGCGEPISDTSLHKYKPGHMKAMYAKMECPLCDCGCGEKVIHPSHKYIKYHATKTPERKKALSERSIKSWQDPEYAANYSAKMKIFYDDPANRAKVGEKTKEFFRNNPEERIKHSERLKAFWQDPEFRNRLLEIFNDPDYKDNQKIVTAAGWTPEKRAATNKNMSKSWTLEQRERMSKIILEYYTHSKHPPASQEQREKQRIMMKELWKDPEYREIRIKQIRERMLDPKYIESISGENHHRWKGEDRMNDPYCCFFTIPYKKEIREWDNNQCRNPYCWKTVEQLSIHHIDYDKMNCHPSNMITVCVSCNSRANHHRSYWRRLYARIRRLDIEQGGE